MTAAETYAEFKTRGGIADLSSRAKFHLTGADRVRFLNGQVSNDIRRLAPEKSLHACVLTAKGKLCADVFVSTGADFLRVDAEESLRENLAARLERYIIADDVTLEDVTESQSLIHIFGRNVLKAACGTDVNPEELAHFPKAGHSGFHRSHRFGVEGYDLFGEKSESSSPLLEKLVQIDNALLETLRIEAGVPRWGFELNEDILPQEAGLERDAVDFHKGCYVGQEVVSRIKSVGHVNRQLRGFVREDDAPLRPGMKLFTPDNPDKEAGSITSAAYSFGLARPAGLGYLRRGVTATVLDARDESGACRVEVKELPLIP